MQRKLMFVMALLMLSIYGFGQGFDEVEIKTSKLTEHIYLLEGAGGNVGIYAAKDGIVMIDNQFAQLSDKLKSAISNISDQQIKYLINTHWHGDHTGGNENFNTEHTTIVAHENVKKRLSTDQFTKAFNRSTPAKPMIYWPEITYDKNLKLHFENEDVRIIHVDHAHTDGDSFVFFPSENVLHMGDCFFNQRFPYIDLSAGGSIKGIIKAANTALMIADDDTTIIPGHGVVASKSDLMEYRDVLVMMLNQVEDAMRKGMSLNDLKVAGFDKGYESWGSGFIKTDAFINTIWTDLDRVEE